MRWINKSNKIKKYWAEAAAKRKRRKEKQRLKSMKIIEKAREEAEHGSTRITEGKVETKEAK